MGTGMGTGHVAIAGTLNNLVFLGVCHGQLNLLTVHELSPLLAAGYRPSGTRRSTWSWPRRCRACTRSR